MEALEHMEAAWRWLEQVNVSGVSVDFLAMARQELRKATAMIKEGENGG